MNVAGAAELLRLSEAGVMALHEAGYLERAEGVEGHAPTFLLHDVKALSARLTGKVEDDVPNQDLSELELFDELEMEASAPADLTFLVSLLHEQAGEMAAKAYTSLCRVYEPAKAWTMEQRARFIDQTRSRFEAIFAMVIAGDDIDLAGELGEVGAMAARSGSSLPELLATLRISRDLVVEAAIELLEMSHQQWSEAFLALVARILPTIDGLTDAISRGYWTALMAGDRDALASLRHEAAFAADAAYVLDLDGQIRGANPALAVLVGWPLATLSGASLADVFVPVEAATAIERLMTDASAQLVTLQVTRPDGVVRRLAIGTSVRRDGHEEAVAFHGVVRDVSWLDDRDILSPEDVVLLATPSVPLRFDLAEVVRGALGAGVGELVALLPAHVMAIGDPEVARRVVGGLVAVLEDRALRIVSVEAENDEWWVSIRFLVDGVTRAVETALHTATLLAQAQGGNLRYEDPRSSVPAGQACLLVTLPSPSLIR
ncbi:MAG: PAS domain-containing protein [Actinobacteria bacterium]|nr:PAS domain-containing protein [Actinomycetota bacterium]